MRVWKPSGIWSKNRVTYARRAASSLSALGAAMVLGLRAQDVHVIFKMGSGCYGCNSADTVSYDAAILSQAVAKPVRVQLSRKDEMISENFGYAFLIIFVIAAVITPTGDMMTQTIFAAPMVGLYLLSIVIAWVVGPKRLRAGADEVN